MLRIVYAGTPEFAVPALQELLRSDHEVVAVYTQPDRPAGRGRKTQVGPVKRCALDADLAIFQPPDFTDQATIDELAALDADLMVVAAYGLILPSVVLEIPRLGCINIHASLLPRWRGASPIQQAILAGDRQTGVTLMQMETGLDTGPVVSQCELIIESDWTAGNLHDRLAPLGAELLIEVLPDVESALQQAQPQVESEASYAPRLTKQQAEFDWQDSVSQLHRQVLAFNPWPVSHSLLGVEPVRIWNAKPAVGIEPGKPGQVVAHERDGIYVSCSDGVLQITELQFAGRNRCNAADALNARSLNGRILGTE